MPRRSVTWAMSKKYGQGYMRGLTQQQTDDEERFHVRVSYPEILALVQEHGHITLRRNTYPMVILSLRILTNDFYYIKGIGEKHRWSRFQQWAKGSIIQLVWEGENAQTLIRKLLRYMGSEETEMKLNALKALKWLPRKGGAPKPEIELGKIAVW